MTSKQVYEEALYVFCAYNTILVGRREHRPLESVLRLCPEKPASMLQSIEVSYADREVSGYETWQDPGPSVTWKEMVRVAWSAQERFPLLRRFLVTSETDVGLFAAEEGVQFADRSAELRVEIWLRWLRIQSEKLESTPPRCLRVRFRFSIFQPLMEKQQNAWDWAIDLYWTKIQVQDPTEKDLEESGKQWIGVVGWWEEAEKERIVTKLSE